MYEDEYRESQQEKDSIAKSFRISRGANGLRKDMIPTRKEYEAKCGDVTTYNYNRPMKWKEFKAMDSAHRVEYIEFLERKYSANSRMLADMFGVSEAAVSGERKMLKLKSVANRSSAKPSKETNRIWQEFICPIMEETPMNNEPEESVENPAVEEKNNPFTMTINSEKNPFTLTINGGTLEGSGKPSTLMPEMITYLMRILPNNCKVSITWTKEEE